jgi:hypothetical protein
MHCAIHTPRDHISQATLSPGPSPGDATGATWGIEEFFMSSEAGGWLRGDDSCEWADQVGGVGAWRQRRAEAGGTPHQM